MDQRKAYGLVPCCIQDGYRDQAPQHPVDLYNIQQQLNNDVKIDMMFRNVELMIVNIRRYQIFIDHLKPCNIALPISF